MSNITNVEWERYLRLFDRPNELGTSQRKCQENELLRRRFSCLLISPTTLPDQGLTIPFTRTTPSTPTPTTSRTVPYTFLLPTS
jgi:hypothetical protein